MPNFAQITIIGHLTRDAETQFIASGTAITRFDIAVNTGFGNNKNTTFYKCQMWGERGQKVAQYLNKGKPVLVSGEPAMKKTTRDDGRAFTDLTVNVRELTLLGGNQTQSPQDRDADNLPDDDQVPF